MSPEPCGRCRVMMVDIQTRWSAMLVLVTSSADVAEWAMVPGAGLSKDTIGDGHAGRWDLRRTSETLAFLSKLGVGDGASSGPS